MTSDNLLIEFGEDHWPHIALHVGDEGRIGAVAAAGVSGRLMKLHDFARPLFGNRHWIRLSRLTCPLTRYQGLCQSCRVLDGWHECPLLGMYSPFWKCPVSKLLTGTVQGGAGRSENHQVRMNADRSAQSTCLATITGRC
jgi:hypothetical protein